MNWKTAFCKSQPLHMAVVVSSGGQEKVVVMVNKWWLG